MQTYKIIINKRDYSSYDIFDMSDFEKKEFNIDPFKEKLFFNDVFTFNENKNVNLVHSTIRIGSNIPGVLLINGNKTYGRKNGKLLYKCVPDDMRIPPFLIPYEIKNMGFSKVFINLYITFSFVDWNDKHPHGSLNNVIGPVDILDNFYEYQLYCKSLNTSIQKFHKDTIKAIEHKSHDTFIESIKLKYPFINDRTTVKEWYIFTIDPPKSQDFDDAFSICELYNEIDIEDNEHKTTQLSIYISNVTIWMDILNLWNSFSQRIATIYLPDKKRPMLPTILSECLCSLQANFTRVAFVMDIFIKDNEIINIKYSNCLIKVSKNYCYEEPDLIKDNKYIQLLNITKNIGKKNSIKNSHDLVCYLMILMNYNCAKHLITHKIGIFRSTIINKTIYIPENIPEEVSKFIKIWNSSSGQYIDGSDIANDKNIRHDLLDMDAYINITSPIRRLVDLLNMIKFQESMNIITLSPVADTFYKKWINELEYINVTMRSIKKLQVDCTLLEKCTNNMELMDKEYDGYIFDKIIRNDGLFQFIVYLPDLKLSSRITLRENISNFESKKFKLFLFKDEENYKKKIRLHLLN
jgi:exoribonuclease R